jgi:hypothetical protein
LGRWSAQAVGVAFVSACFGAHWLINCELD